MIKVLTNQSNPLSAGWDTLNAMNYRPKRSVFIKPNIGATSHRVNTDPMFVKGMVLYLHAVGVSQVVIGEGSVVTEYESTGYNFHHQGWDAVAEDLDVQLIDLNTAKRVNGLPEALVGRDYVNVAKMKTHMQTTVSLCCKNQKGLLAPAERKKFHEDGLHVPIRELAQRIQPTISVIEGITGIEGNGPGDYGTSRKDGIIVAGDNMFEVDYMGCRIMGIDPEKVEHLKGTFSGEAAEVPKVRSYILPDMEFKMFNVHLCAGNACSACLSSVGKLNKLVRERRNLKELMWFARRGIIGRMDIIVGNQIKLPENHGYVVFYGKCTKQLADQYPEYPYIQGCPPVSAEALKELTK